MKTHKLKRPTSKAKTIVKGKPVKIRGLVEGPNGQILVLMRWTTADCYVPYELAKRHFQDLLLKFLVASPEELKAD